MQLNSLEKIEHNDRIQSTKEGNFNNHLLIDLSMTMSAYRLNRINIKNGFHCFKVFTQVFNYIFITSNCNGTQVQFSKGNCNGNQVLQVQFS
jgi:hypothetical protein